MIHLIWLTITIIVCIASLAIGYFYGGFNGYDEGYDDAYDDGKFDGEHLYGIRYNS